MHEEPTEAANEHASHFVMPDVTMQLYKSPMPCNRLFMPNSVYLKCMAVSPADPP